jgi:hypothetical protein
VSKLANPWKCDATGCGQLRAKDTNHWLIVRVQQADSDHGDGPLEVVISRWTDDLAELACAKHACGLPCGLKVASALIMETFFPADISLTGKEGTNGGND